MTETFYPVTEDMPAIGVRVVVTWAGRVFKAARVVDKKARAVRWATEEDGKLVYLPPRGQEKRWGEEPNVWRPERPDLWKAPLPEPLTPANPRRAARAGSGGARDARGALHPEPPQAAGRNRYAAMSAQAEQSARTMAEIRDELGTEREEAEDAIEEILGDHRWWLTEKLTYSAPGEVSVREAEGRVAIAILVDGIRGRFGGPSGLSETSSTLAGLVHEALQSTDADVTPETFDPSPRDLSDYDTAFAWFTALNPPELWWSTREPWSLSQAQCVLVWRVIGKTWRQIAKLAKCSHSGARQMYGAALDGVHRAANGQPVLQHVKVRDRMTALRERNRKARIEG
ncbi:MAG: hypothetical protein ACK4TP_10155 [Hyphomicrobium sp.]